MKKLKIALTVYLSLASMIGFGLFILEESSQIATFSTFMSKSNHDLTLMNQASKLMDINNRLIVTINNTIGWINPLGYISYNKYADAQALYSQAIKNHILIHQPEILEGRTLEFEFTPNQIQDGMLINGKIQVVTQLRSLNTFTVKGVVRDGKVYNDDLHSADDRVVEQLQGDRDE